MGSDTRRDKPRKRTRTIELLEDRRVMSADPIGGMLGGLIQQHSLDTAPSLVHHASPDADFWIDSWSERDLDVLAGDIEQTLASAHGSTGLTGVRNDYGFTGAGQTVAVIDSGIAWNHTGLGGGLGANYRVVGGWDFTENDANPYDDGPWGSHGTHVAGIVGADAAGTNNDGVAPGVDLVGLRVFDDAGAGYFSWVESALQWVHQNRNAFENPITAVNLSLGTSWNSNTIPSWTTLEDEFAELKADGIFVAVSAGNSFSTYNTPGLSYPAASPYVVPVMSVMDNGSLSSFSQRHMRAIGAPGQYITSTVPDYAGNNNGINDDYASYSGTSMASPYIAGASVLLREAMQFVGYANITQDTIYDHMMATATAFLDSATGQTYKRINLTNAFNALMPTDEYGSTAVAAQNLGTLSGESEISGLIGKLSDSDFFRFTAAATGTVTFTATTTHGLAPVWSATGGTVSGSRGESYTFDVAAGQSYTIGLSTSGGIGYYDLAVEAESSFTYTDWGAVTQSQTNNDSNAGESWYRITASRTGYLTTEALFATAGGHVELAIYDSNLQLLTNGATNAAGERADLWATAGDSYFVCVVGTNADVDFRLTNLVSLSGATLSVAGTSAADAFTYAVDTAQHTVSVNGTAYQFNKAAVSTINFAGDAGSDSITMTGSTGAETAILRVGEASITGLGFTALSSGVENVTLISGGGADVVNVYDSAGDDQYRAFADRVAISGTGFVNEAVGFRQTYAYASTGNDTAWAYDSAGDDLFRQWSTHFVFSGQRFYNYARGFDESYAYAGKGFDRAILYDSAGDDLFRSWSDHHVFSGDGFYNYIRAFDDVQAYASQGYDRAIFYDSAGDDLFRSWTDRAQMSGAGYFSYGRNFDNVQAYATLGNDRADFFDSSGDDLFRAWHDRAHITGVGYFNYAKGFDSNYAYASTGNDRADFFDAGNFFCGLPNQATLSGPGFYQCANNFDLACAYTLSGINTGTISQPPSGAILNSIAFRISAEGFSDIQTQAATNTDRESFGDSIRADTGYARYGRTQSVGGFRPYRCAIDQAPALATTGCHESEDYESPWNDRLLVRLASKLSDAGIQEELGEVNSFAAQLFEGGDKTTELQATDIIFELIGQRL